MDSMRDVKRIYLDERGISHIVASEGDGWVHLLCDRHDTGESMSAWPLKPRICRKCRKRLKTATMAGKAKRDG